MKKLIAITMSVIMCASLFVGCDKKDKVIINTKEDLVGKKIAVQNGTTGQKIAEGIENSKVDRMNSGLDAALKVKNGSADAVILDKLPATAIVEKNPDLKILNLEFEKEEYAIAVKKGNKELLDSINATLKEIKENGKYDELAKAFMPADGKIKIPKTIVGAGSKELKMGTNATFKPFEYLEGSNIVGFDISLSEMIAEKYGAKLTVNNMDFEALIPALSAGTVDFVVAGMTVDEERLKSVDFSEPYYESEQVVIVRK